MSDVPDSLAEIADRLFDAVSDDVLLRVADRLLPLVADRLGPLVRQPTPEVQPPGNADLEDPLLTADEVAAILGYTSRYVGRLGRDGALPRFRPPGRKYVRYPKSGVLAYRATGEQPARATVKSGPPHPHQSFGMSQGAGQAPARRRF
jgi:predicted DNA-binding transcriptional regulator AlpA